MNVDEIKWLHAAEMSDGKMGPYSGIFILLIYHQKDNSLAAP